MYCKIHISLWNVLELSQCFPMVTSSFLSLPWNFKLSFHILGLNTALWKFSLSQIFSPWSSYPNTVKTQRLEVSAPKNKCAPFPHLPNFANIFIPSIWGALHNSIHRNYCCKALFWSSWRLYYWGTSPLCQDKLQVSLQSACFELRSIALFFGSGKVICQLHLREYVEHNYSSQFTQRWGGEMKFSVCLDETVFMFLDLIN